MDSTLHALAVAPAAERAPDVVTLEPAECDQLLALAQNLTVSPSESPELYCRQARRAARRAPDRLVELLTDFATRGTDSGTMLFDRLPADALWGASEAYPQAPTLPGGAGAQAHEPPLHGRTGAQTHDPSPPTPPDNRHHVGETTVLARVQAIVNHTCGDMLAYAAEGYGRLYQDMVPNQALAQSQTSLGSRVELELHTEQAFSLLRPDVLSLACLRGHPDAHTYVLPAHMLVAHMSQFERALLRQPLWMTGVDGSFRQDGLEFIEGDERGPLAIVGGAEDDPTIVFDQDLMRGLTDDAHALIDRVVEIYRAERRSVILEPGQILLVDNVRSVHGRSPFTPSFDGRDRFIIRSFAVRDLVRTRYARPGNARAIAAEHS
jgi:L-asparagine oxygenase